MLSFFKCFPIVSFDETKLKKFVNLKISASSYLVILIILLFTPNPRWENINFDFYMYFFNFDSASSHLFDISCTWSYLKSYICSSFHFSQDILKIDKVF